MAALRLVVGLGNPGPEHAGTRHNAGFWFVDALAADLGVPFALDRKLHAEVAKARVAGEILWLLRPTTYMNRSGLAVMGALSALIVPACVAPARRPPPARARPGPPSRA